MNVINTNAMDRLLTKKYEVKPRNRGLKRMVLVPTKKEKQVKEIVPHIPAEFCALVKEKIFTMPFFLSQCSSLEEAGQCLSNLARTNHFLNSLVNDREATLADIKQLSQQFDRTNLDVARALCTEAGKNRWAVQLGLWINWRRCHNNYKDKKRMDDLKKCWLDVNFSYDKEYPSPLLQCCSDLHNRDGAAHWLIDNGADINMCTPLGNNACILVLLRGLDHSMLNKLVEHKDFKPNHQNCFGATVLHCYLGHIKDAQGDHFGTICSTITKILAKGANPALVNKAGESPLVIARMIQREETRKPIVALLEQAAINFSSQEK